MISPHLSTSFSSCNLDFFLEHREILILNVLKLDMHDFGHTCALLLGRIMHVGDSSTEADSLFLFFFHVASTNMLGSDLWSRSRV
ncbi:hypothetical protein ACE6H2_026942 [Prunus campanulata]